MNPETLLQKLGQSVGSFFNALFSSTSFLSRLPLYQDGDEVERLEFSRIAYAFPLAGMLIALPSAIMLLLCFVAHLPPIVSAVLTVGMMAVTTGGLHEDGLADVADGFWGGHTRDRKLEIMRDSATGTYGTMALFLSLALRVGLLATLFAATPPLQATAIVIAVSALSRTALLWPWVSLPAARPSSNSEGTTTHKDEAGLSARFGEPNQTTLLIAIFCSLPAIAMMQAASGNGATLCALVLCAVLVVAFTLLAKSHVDGHTGDVLGATQQISEMGLLLGLVAIM